MGSSSSKDGSASSSSSSASAAAVGAEIRRSRSMGSRVFQSSCLGRSLRSYNTENDDQVYDDRNKENWSLSRVSTCPDQNGTESDQVKQEGRRKVKLHQQPNEVPSISSNAWGQEIVAESGSMADEGVPPSLSSRSLVSSSRSHSRFSFIPGNMSFRLSRAASLGSTRACSIFSNSITTSNSEEGLNVHSNSSVHSLNRNGTRQGCDLFPISGPSSEHYEVSTTSSALRFDPAASGLSVGLQDDAIVSRRDRSRYNVNTGILSDTNARTPRNHTEIDRIETRRANRRTGDREPVERSVRFSRTLSVGRLRDRVLRRSSVTDGLSGRQHEDREVGDTTQGNGRQVSSDTTRTPASDTNAEISPASSSYPPSSISDYVFHGQEVEASRPREARYHDIMEHRTDFLERRRRIRSQVRALQRLGSRFENLSGHERSCILSGQHRTGRCSCRTNNRTRNLDDDTSARASISRIVMLAEALFEVLDEIHQQSVVLSSRPSVSSLGSVPAPKEVVESMPVKIYTKLQKHQSEDVAQCYICLLEYEEGDCMRILPCHHEFHRACIDKWLKEIHRVCPLCRGDVCRSDSLPLEN